MRYGVQHIFISFFISAKIKIYVEINTKSSTLTKYLETISMSSCSFQQDKLALSIVWVVSFLYWISLLGLSVIVEVCHVKTKSNDVSLFLFSFLTARPCHEAVSSANPGPYSYQILNPKFKQDFSGCLF